MITLETVLLLQQKVEGAVAKIQNIEAERNKLSEECEQLRVERNALQAQIADIKGQYDALMQNQSQIEASLLHSLDRLGSVAPIAEGGVQNAPQESNASQQDNGQSSPQESAQMQDAGNNGEPQNGDGQWQNNGQSSPQSAEMPDNGQMQDSGQMQDDGQEQGEEQNNDSGNGQFDIF